MKVLILAYDYLPVTSIGALRPASWVKHFDKEKFEIRIVTGSWRTSDSNLQVQYSQKRFSFREKFLSGNRFFISFLRKPISLLRLLGSFVTFIMDDKREIYRTAEQNMVSWKPDLIIATSEPFILFRYANRLSQKYDIPWVADYRDPWSTEQSVREKSQLFAFLNDYYFRYIEKKLLCSASAITTPCEPYKKLIQRVLPKANIHIIPNGYDLPADFKRTNPNLKKLTFCYLGRLYPHRKFQIFLDGLFRFYSITGNENIEVRFYGLKSYPEQKDQIDSYNQTLKPFLKFYDLIPYDDVMLLAQDCHICLMFSDGKSNFSPGKLYDYIGLNRKIWLTPQDGGFLTEIIQSKNLGLVLNSEEEIAHAIKKAFEEFQSGNSNIFLNPTTEEFSRKSSAQKFEKLLELTLSKSKTDQ